MKSHAELKHFWNTDLTGESVRCELNTSASIIQDHWKDLLAAYSLATLWLVISWKELLFSDTGDYLAFEPRALTEHIAIFTVAATLTLVLYLLLRFVRSASRKWSRRALQATFVAIGALSFGPLSFEIFKWLTPEIRRLTTFPLPLVVAFICITFAIIKRRLCLADAVVTIQTIAILAAPFGLLILAKSAANFALDDGTRFLPQNINRLVSTDRSKPYQKRVVWIIFDEFDFAARRVASQNHTPLPDVERLRNESFLGRNAYSPNRDTLVSIPALLTGRRLRKAEPISVNDLMLFPEDSSGPFSLRKSETIFSEAQAAGIPTAIVGWYHPYSRIFQESVSSCVWQPRVDRRCAQPSRFFRCSLGIIARSLDATPFVSRLLPASLTGIHNEYIPEEIETQSERTAFLYSKAANLVADQTYGLVFLHFSVPHAPYIDRHGPDEEGSYFTALEIVNDMIKNLRETLEKAGQWDKTVLIISSDHPWRGKKLEENQLMFLNEKVRQEVIDDKRIPFIVKFPGRTDRFEYDRRFNTVVTKNIIRDIFADKITGPEDLASWLDQLDDSERLESPWQH